MLQAGSDRDEHGEKEREHAAIRAFGKAYDAKSPKVART